MSWCVVVRQRSGYSYVLQEHNTKAPAEKIAKKAREELEDAEEVLVNFVKPDPQPKENWKNYGEDNAQAKLTWESVRKIRELYFKNGKTLRDLAKEFRVVPSTIHLIVSNKRWKE